MKYVSFQIYTRGVGKWQKNGELIGICQILYEIGKFSKSYSNVWFDSITWKICIKCYFFENLYPSGVCKE